MQKILISACLLGQKVRYDGNSLCIDHPLLRQWQQQQRLVPLCPEMAGGLPVPRAAAEISGGSGADVITRQARVLDRFGNDVSENFIKGAECALAICRQHDISIALLAARSPSCGNEWIYDGSFSKRLVQGAGVTAALLQQNDIRVFHPEQLESLRLCLESQVKN